MKRSAKFRLHIHINDVVCNVYVRIYVIFPIDNLTQNICKASVFSCLLMILRQMYMDHLICNSDLAPQQWKAVFVTKQYFFFVGIIDKMLSCFVVFIDRNGHHVALFGLCCCCCCWGGGREKGGSLLDVLLLHRKTWANVHYVFEIGKMSNSYNIVTIFGRNKYGVYNLVCVISLWATCQPAKKRTRDGIHYHGNWNRFINRIPFHFQLRQVWLLFVLKCFSLSYTYVRPTLGFK